MCFSGTIISIEGIPGLIKHPLTFLPVFLSSAFGFGSQRISALTTDNSRSDQLEELAHLFDEGKFKIPVDSVFPLTEGGKAMKRSYKGAAKGKIILQIE